VLRRGLRWGSLQVTARSPELLAGFEEGREREETREEEIGREREGKVGPQAKILPACI